MTIGTIASLHTKQIYTEVLYGDSSHNFTVPLITDSAAAERMSFNQKSTKRTRHIDRRWFFNRQARLDGHISVHHAIAKYSLADLGTKNQSAFDADYQLKVKVVTSHHNSVPRANTVQGSVPTTTIESKKGDVTQGQNTDEVQVTKAQDQSTDAGQTSHATSTRSTEP